MNEKKQQIIERSAPEKKSLAANHDGQSFQVYETPVLISYGDVRDITLGPSPGAGESRGGGFLFDQPL